MKSYLLSGGSTTHGLSQQKRDSNRIRKILMLMIGLSCKFTQAHVNTSKLSNNNFLTSKKILDIFNKNKKCQLLTEDELKETEVCSIPIANKDLDNLYVLDSVLGLPVNKSNNLKRVIDLVDKEIIDKSVLDYIKEHNHEMGLRCLYVLAGGSSWLRKFIDSERAFVKKMFLNALPGYRKCAKSEKNENSRFEFFSFYLIDKLMKIDSGLWIELPLKSVIAIPKNNNPVNKYIEALNVKTYAEKLQDISERLNDTRDNAHYLRWVNYLCKKVIKNENDRELFFRELNPLELHKDIVLTLYEYSKMFNVVLNRDFNDQLSLNGIQRVQTDVVENSNNKDDKFHFKSLFNLKFAALTIPLCVALNSFYRSGRDINHDNQLCNKYVCFYTFLVGASRNNPVHNNEVQKLNSSICREIGEYLGVVDIEGKQKINRNGFLNELYFLQQELLGYASHYFNGKRVYGTFGERINEQIRLVGEGRLEYPDGRTSYGTWGYKGNGRWRLVGEGRIEFSIGQKQYGTWGYTEDGQCVLTGEGRIDHSEGITSYGTWGDRGDGQWGLTGDIRIEHPDGITSYGICGDKGNGEWGLVGEGRIEYPDGITSYGTWGDNGNGQWGLVGKVRKEYPYGRPELVNV